jgi:hypothetical protein
MRCEACGVELGHGPFKVGDRVRAHTDCRTEPNEPAPFAGVLADPSHLGDGWFHLRPDDPLSCLGIGTTTVHEQELERLTCPT